MRISTKVALKKNEKEKLRRGKIEILGLNCVKKK